MHEEQLEKLGSFSLSKGRLEGQPPVPNGEQMEADSPHRHAMEEQELTVSSCSKTNSDLRGKRASRVIKNWNGLTRQLGKTSILGNFQHLTVQCPKQPEKASRSATLSRVLDPMIPRDPFHAKLIVIFQ